MSADSIYSTNDSIILEKMDKIRKSGMDKGFDLLYMWVKQEQINKRQFVSLVEWITENK